MADGQGDQAGLNGSGAIAQGQGASALGQGAVQIQGDNHGNITVLIEQGRRPGASAEALRQAYLARLMLQLDQLPLAVGSRAAELRLSSVYTALLTQRSEGDMPGRFTREALRALDDGITERRQLSALEVLNTESRLVLLGGPGSGKTTFASIVALSMAGELLREEGGPNLATLTAPLPKEAPEDLDRVQEPLTDRQPWVHGALLPVQIVLRDLAAQLPPPGCPIDAQVVWAYLSGSLTRAQQEAFEPHLRTELQERGGLLLFDGLDEVPDADQRREQIKQAVQQFAAAYPRCRVLVTSRTYAYQNQDWKLDRFAEVQLLPFTPAQQHAFVDAWYAHMVALLRLSEPAARDRAERLKREADRNPRIAELAQRPLLLTLMAQLQTEGGGDLPEKREALYDKAVEMLLNQWENYKIHVRDDGTHEQQPSLTEWLKASRDAVRTQLNRLAFEAHRDQPQLVGTADIAQDKLIAALRRASTNNRDVRLMRLEEYLCDRAGLFATHGEELYQFPHRSFQEYLAACHLTDDDFPEKIAGLARRDPNRWREVTLLAGAKAVRGVKGSAWDLAEALHCGDDDNPESDPTSAQRWGDLLAGHVLAECADLSQTPSRKKRFKEEIIAAQVGLLRDTAMPAVERALAGRTLAALGDPRPEVMTLDGMQFCLVPAGPFTMGSDQWLDEEKPMHRLDISYSYLMARYPVTVAQWNEYVQVSGCSADERSGQGRQNDPVQNVNQEDARCFCRWLTQRWQNQLPASWEVTLPSEVEWEKAARGGEKVPAKPALMTAEQCFSISLPALVSRTDDSAGQEYIWGDEFDTERANCADTGLAQTSAVGAFPAGGSAYGCEEMAGNVWEWTRSLWGKDWNKSEFVYPYDIGDVERENLEVGTEVWRVVRGGAWCDFHGGVRSACRGWDFPLTCSDIIGFRVVLRHSSD